MAKAPAKALNQTPPPGERPPGRTPSPRQLAAKEAEKAAVTDAPVVEPATPDDFPEREAAEPPQTPKPLAKTPVATKVTAPAGRIKRDKATGKVKPAAKPKVGAALRPPTPEAPPAPKAPPPPPPPPPPAGDNMLAQDALVGFIERVENLEAEKKALSDDIRDVYTEAKLSGFNSAIMRECVKIRKLEPEQREEKYNLLALYTRALGLDLGFDLI